MTQDDLFGHEYALTPAQQRRLKPKYQKRGHAGRPGEGPKGETCGSCANLVRRERRSGRKDLKCALMQVHWTNSYGTDVRSKDRACRHWRQPEKESNDGGDNTGAVHTAEPARGSGC